MVDDQGPIADEIQVYTNDSLKTGIMNEVIDSVIQFMNEKYN